MADSGEGYTTKANAINGIESVKENAPAAPIEDNTSALPASRNLLAYYKGAEIDNRILHDESIAFATDLKYPESDHAPVIAEFELSD